MELRVKGQIFDASFCCRLKQRSVCVMGIALEPY